MVIRAEGIRTLAGGDVSRAEGDKCSNRILLVLVGVVCASGCGVDVRDLGALLDRRKEWLFHFRPFVLPDGRDFFSLFVLFLLGRLDLPSIANVQYIYIYIRIYVAIVTSTYFRL